MMLVELSDRATSTLFADRAELSLKRKLKNRFFLSLPAVFTLAVAPVVSADILFLDLNDGPLEVAAAQRAAAKRGEKLIVWPAGKSKVDKPELREELLTESLKSLEARGVKLSSVVISGHDGNGMFAGTHGSFSSDEVKSAFASVPSLRDGVRSVGLWGCYTATMGQIEGNWKHVFPNSALVAGFDGSAPANTRLASATYLEDVLVKEAQLLKITDRNELNKAFRALKNVTSTRASLCLNHDLFVSVNGKPTSISEAMGECRPTERDEEFQSKMQCYLNAEETCVDVPASTGAGPLREYYNSLQAGAHCDSILAEMQIERPSRDVLIRLIFEKQVRANFENQFNEDLKYADEMLARVKAPADLRFSDLSKLSRKDFLDRVKALTAFYHERKKAARSERDPAVRLRIKEELTELDGLTSAVSRLGSLDPEEIPFGWVEPNARDPYDGPAFHKFAQGRYLKQINEAKYQIKLVEEGARSKLGPKPESLIIAERKNDADRKAFNDFVIDSENANLTLQQRAGQARVLGDALDKSSEQVEKQTAQYEKPFINSQQVYLMSELSRLKSTNAPAPIIRFYQQELSEIVTQEIDSNAGGERMGLRFRRELVLPWDPPDDAEGDRE